MKRIKKIASLLLAMVMVFAMSVTAFATEPTEPTDTAGEEKDTYEIFQIFTGTWSTGDVLSDIKWGQNAKNGESTVKVGDLVPTDVLDVLKALDDKTDNEKLETIEKYANLTNPVETGNDTSYKVAPGYYLIRSTKALSVDNSQNKAYTLYVVKVTDGDLTFTPKVDVPEVDKKIVDESIEGGKGDINEASIGDVVNYEITATLPTERYEDYDTYYLEFVDTLSAGLTYNDGSVKLTYKEPDGEEKDVATDAYTFTNTNGNISVKINDAKAITEVAGSQIIVRYNATLNANAVVGSAGNPNTVKLVYSNDPNHSGSGTPGPNNPDHPTGETPEEKVITYTTQIKITKRKEDTQDILPGAGFTLTGTNVNVGLIAKEEYKTEAEIAAGQLTGTGTYYKLQNGTFTETAPTEGTMDDYVDDTVYQKVVVLEQVEEPLAKSEITGIVDPETGTLIFRGLGAGTYTLTESTTPEGYNTMQPKTIVIGFNFDINNPQFTIKNVDENGNVYDSGLNFGEPNEEDGNVYGLDFATDIANFSGNRLPSTGGIGTTIFYVVGGILVIGAGILLVTKRRMKAQ